MDMNRLANHMEKNVEFICFNIIVIISYIDYLLVIRPINVVITSIMAIAGLYFGNQNSPIWNYILATIVVIAYTGIAMIHNDVLDIEIDRINAPDKILPSGRISKWQAYSYAFILFILGTIAGLFLTPESWLIMLLVLALSFLYNSYLKKLGIVGNIVVGITAATSFLYGDVVAGGWNSFWPHWTASIYLFLIATLINTAREICKGIMDTTGDEKYGVGTIAVLYGTKTASILALIFFAAAIAFSVVPIIYNVFGTIVYISMIIMVFVGFYFGKSLVQNPNYDSAKKFKNSISISALLAVPFLILDKFVLVIS